VFTIKTDHGLNEVDYKKNYWMGGKHFTWKE
jgi:hypothetical protein